MPKVSVVISTFNRPEKLKRAIESVQNQTFKDWELIVVHDGLWTEYPMAIPDIEKSEWIKFNSVEHFGNDTKPKNHGISLSTGDYIAFLDDDNIWRPDHLQVLVNELNRNPQIAMVYGDRWIIDEDKKLPSQVGLYADYEVGRLFQENFIDTSDVLIRREALFAVGGFDESNKKYIDWNLWVRLEKYGFKFKRVAMVLTDYYRHSESKSKKVLTKKEQEYMDTTGLFKNIPDWDAVDCEIELPYLGAKQKPKVAIFSLTYDRLEYTKKCFESLDKTAGYPFTHFIIDNGSTDGTKEWLESNRDFSPEQFVIFNEKNKGISAASNQALEYISKEDFDIIVKVDNDCLFLTDGWLAKMVDIWKANHRMAMSCYVQGLRDNPGGAPRYSRGQVRGELIGMTRHLGGICHFVDSKAYKNFRWPEFDFLHGRQDLEFSQHLNNEGFAMGYLENYYLEHIDGTEGQEAKYPEYFERRKTEKTTRYEKK